MKNNKLLLATFMLAFLFAACNPDCNTYTNIFSNVQPEFRTPGAEVLITTTPTDFLENRAVFIQKQNLGESSIEEMPSYFAENVGRVATLPMDVEDSQTILIEDGDCGGYIPLSSVNVQNSTFFTSNLDFITPPPPIIIIPQAPITPPVNVVNAWFSPDDPAYCIWFGPALDADGNEIATLIPGDLSNGGPDPVTNRVSIELSAGCDTPADEDLFHNNPVSGIVDKVNNVIQIQIDRSSKGLGIEEFEGHFIDPEDLPSGYGEGSPCGGDNVYKAHWMILKSKKTGQQLLLFQN